MVLGCSPGGGYSHTLPIRVSAAQRGRDFEALDLERGIIFRMHESSSFVSSHLKLLNDRLLLKIRFNALTSKVLYSCCTLENWPISRTGCQLGVPGGTFPPKKYSSAPLPPGMQSTKFYIERLCPEVQPLTLLYTIFWQKRYALHIPSINK